MLLLRCWVSLAFDTESYMRFVYLADDKMPDLAGSTGAPSDDEIEVVVVNNRRGEPERPDRANDIRKVAYPAVSITPVSRVSSTPVTDSNVRELESLSSQSSSQVSTRPRRTPKASTLSPSTSGVTIGEALGKIRVGSRAGGQPCPASRKRPY